MIPQCEVRCTAGDQPPDMATTSQSIRKPLDSIDVLNRQTTADIGYGRLVMNGDAQILCSRLKRIVGWRAHVGDHDFDARSRQIESRCDRRSHCW